MAQNLSKRIYDEYFEEMFTTRDAWIGQILRKDAVPPIRGEITPGKIRWRGIVLKRITGRDGNVEAIGEFTVQRGRQIGPMFMSDNICSVN